MSGHLDNPERDHSIKYLMDSLNSVYGFDREMIGICVTAAFHFLGEENETAGIDKVKKIICGYHKISKRAGKCYQKPPIGIEKMPRKENRVLRVKSAFAKEESDTE